MTELIEIVDATQIHEGEGLFIPKALFSGYERVEIEIADDGTIVLRPGMRPLHEVCQSMDARREMLREKYGLVRDSSQLIRQDRDSR
jgi:hypothetical protein